MNPIKFLKKLFISTYAVEVCKHPSMNSILNLYSWMVRNPALSSDMYQAIKDTVKVIRMY